MNRSRGRVGPGPAATLFVCLFAAQAALLVLSPILPLVAGEFGISMATAGQLRAISGATAAVAALIVAVAGGRFRLSNLLTAGLVLLASGSLASAAAPSFSLLIGAQVVIGLGLALVLSGGLAASEAWTSGKDRSRTLSWALIGQPVAWIVGQPLAGLAAAADWRWAWVAVPFAAAVLGLVVLALRERTGSDEGRECDPLALRTLPGVRRWAAGELLAFSAWAGILVYAGALFIETYGASVRVTGTVLGLCAVAYLPGNFWGRRRLGPGASRLIIGSAGAAAVTVTLLCVVRPGIVISALVFAVLAFFAAARTIAGASLGLDLSGGRRLAVMSLRTAALQLGYLLGAGMAGVVLPRWGFAGIGWGFGALFAAGAAVHLPGTVTVRGLRPRFVPQPR